MLSDFHSYLHYLNCNNRSSSCGNTASFNITFLSRSRRYNEGIAANRKVHVFLSPVPNHSHATKPKAFPSDSPANAKHPPRHTAPVKPDALFGSSSLPPPKLQAEPVSPGKPDSPDRKKTTRYTQLPPRYSDFFFPENRCIIKIRCAITYPVLQQLIIHVTGTLL